MHRGGSLNRCWRGTGLEHRFREVFGGGIEWGGECEINSQRESECYAGKKLITFLGELKSAQKEKVGTKEKLIKRRTKERFLEWLDTLR